MEGGERNRIRVFTWHIHGSYLYYLSKAAFEIYIPVKENKSEGYIGYGTTFPFGNNVHEVSLEALSTLSIDCIIFQSPKNYQHDQYEILTAAQRAVPRLYLEHNPPEGHPTNTPHVVTDPAVRIVHVTHFNNLMWDNNGLASTVIDHGIPEPSVQYRGEIPRGLVIINNLKERGRRLGLDIFLEARKHVPLDLIGMNAQEVGGLGEILHPQLPAFIAQYRFFFNPIRYTSLGLAVLEAMMAGVPVVGMATTEMVTVFKNGVSGFVHTDITYLIDKMKLLLEQKDLAERIGSEGKKIALQRFNIKRFTDDWERFLRSIVERDSPHPKIESHQILQQQL